jgi:hypothetical protein
MEGGSIDPFALGHWVGQAEDLFSPPGPDGDRPPYTFPSGATQMLLDLSLVNPAAPNEGITGQIIFGEGHMPEPMSGVAYPPGLDATRTSTLEAGAASLPPFEGFSYFLRQSSYGGAPEQGMAAGALALEYSANESYADWCAVQPTRSDGAGNFDCLTPIPRDSIPPSGATCTSRESGGVVRYDCGVGYICQAMCACTRTGCRPAQNSTVQLWLVREGAGLDGTFGRAVFDYGDAVRFLPVGNVRFQRQEP